MSQNQHLETCQKKKGIGRQLGYLVQALLRGNVPALEASGEEEKGCCCYHHTSENCGAKRQSVKMSEGVTGSQPMREKVFWEDKKRPLDISETTSLSHLFFSPVISVGNGRGIRTGRGDFGERGSDSPFLLSQDPVI